MSFLLDLAERKWEAQSYKKVVFKVFFNDLCSFSVFVCVHAPVLFFIFLLLSLFYDDMDHWSDANEWMNERMNSS